MLKRILLIAGSGIAVCAIGIFLILHFNLVEVSQVSVGGWFAFGIAAALCIILSAGLYSLAFFSARSGQDDISDYK